MLQPRIRYFSALRALRNKTPRVSQVENQVEQPTDAEESPLSPAELEAINNIQSSLYQPSDPFLEPSKADLIQQKIDAISQKLERQKQLEQAKYQKLIEEQEQALRPTLSDYKRPITSFLLLGSGVYLLLQYAWTYLEGEEHIIAMEQKTREYEKEIQTLLDQQVPKKKWFWN
ncbi:hypothetical protein KL918_004051 [Ogataea parapolymorpha]|uniref:Uncharacterized protein n=1 Tax=Ogataea parapolymorpha (strain ATCC 26012 / BCRC 20466 / JCM 22074 / NRRL Y-7560 / DL-1) TaxID=871575 RepID=W1QAZ7_OGAPD|nr:hypothetical protein HPODL_05232 [Ogataea parapolymorpha DL-1]ESW98206.1 hypothetical protein HPODL_05232 [Ogataea parapolymorpha DL-1]KAG7866062.1 hypothetical protein KL918_004051 [Ogataea parapolymorpha]KAG7874784.1 hypothetical protein KL916_001028 [Ogataea parapolymorpha]